MPKIFYTQTDATHGTELWLTDGMPNAPHTRLVKDINPGSTSSSIGSLTSVNGKVFFSADDGSGGLELWESDGTAAGTFMVADIRSGALSSTPANLTNVNGELFFTANDGSHGFELWKSDGTAAGTMMVKDIDPGPFSSNPAFLTNVNGTLYFTANDGTNGTALWKSDGTSGGTSIVATGLFSSTAVPLRFASALNSLFFDVRVNGGVTNLYRSVGTSVGTTQIASGISDFQNPYDNGADFVECNGTLLFGKNGALWKTDGTVNGTVQVKDLASEPFNFATVGSLTYFATVIGGTTAGTANSWYLWVTDGTQAAQVVRLPDGTVAPSHLTASNGLLFFEDMDPQTVQPALWVSDGTAQGTVVLKDGYATQADTVIFANAITNLTDVNGTLFFDVRTASGYDEWKSRGTAASTTLVAPNVDPAAGIAAVPGNVVTTDDFNGDGSGDVLLYNSNNSQVGEWLMKNGQLSQGQAFGALGVGSGWSIVGSGDFNGDGTSDVLLYNSNTSQLGEWLMQNGQLLQGQAFGALGVDSGWATAGTGDFNGDGTTDVLLYNSNNTQVGAWLMQNGQLSQGQSFGTLGAGSGWAIAGTGDFNGDGTTDVLLYNSNTSQVGEWLMKNGQLAQGQAFGTLGVSSGWSIAGTGDFNGDGTTDILLYNSNTSQIGVWLMQNGQLTAGANIGALGVGSGWSIAGTGDFNGDGTSDILLHNSNNTQVGEWLMQNGQLAQGQGFGTLGAGSGWQLKQV